MKNSIKIAICGTLAFGLSACITAKNDQNQNYVPEENGLNLIKLTDESKGSVMGPRIWNWSNANFQTSQHAGSKKGGMRWPTLQLLRVSPKGDEIAHLTEYNDQKNIIIRKAKTNSATTQRTFKNVLSFCWGNDDVLYFSEVEPANTKINAVNAHTGSIIRQITANNNDYDPVLTEDGTILFFTRFINNTEPMIWSYNMKTGEMTNCTRGYNPAIIGDRNDEIICVRNNNNGQSEIWCVNYKDGKETMILTDAARSYSNPHVSPDGEWIVMQGNSISAGNKTKNLDLFAMRIDGSDFMQLTFHPGDDTNPQWSADGKDIYFISNRAAKKGEYNVWKMKFKPY